LESLPYLTDYVTGPTKFLLSGIAWSKKDDHEWISNVSYNPQGLCFFTKMFIYPGFSPYVIDWLITNFHLPKTSLLVLVATLLGWQEMLLEVYMHAIEKKYRFYSFGDGMMVLNK
jgi:S-adenosylmethionine:tRNA-ribosyltransferase-isomerase (queuine synthetase)